MLNSLKLKYSAIILLIFSNLFCAKISLGSTDASKSLISPTTFNKLLINQGVGAGVSSAAISSLDYLDGQWQPQSVLGYIGKYLLRFQAAYLVTLTNHEVFGHGSRMLEAGANIDAIKINFLISNLSYVSSDSKIKEAYRKALISAGGNEVNHILGESLKSNMLTSNHLSPFESFSYCMSQGNQLFYNTMTFLAPSSYFGESEGDIRNYAHHVFKAMSFAPAAKGLDKATILADIKFWAFLDLLDPFLYYSLYSISTDTNIKLPMFSLTENLEYLPAARLLMAPYGLEAQFVNHFRTPNHVAKVTFSYGSTFDLKSYRLQGVISNILNFAVGSIDAEACIWSQPDFIRKQTATPINGVLGRLTFNYNLTSIVQVSISGGYKSEGYQPGYGIEEGMLFGLGGSIQF